MDSANTREVVNFRSKHGVHLSFISDDHSVLRDGFACNSHVHRVTYDIIIVIILSLDQFFQFFSYDAVQIGPGLVLE